MKARASNEVEEGGAGGKEGAGAQNKTGRDKEGAARSSSLPTLPRKMEKMTLGGRGKREALGFKILLRGKGKRQIGKTKRRPRGKLKKKQRKKLKKRQR